jgi:hypothetical protein
MAVRGQGDYKIYISVVLLLRSFMSNAYILERGMDMWQKKMDCGVAQMIGETPREVGEGSAGRM